MNWGNNGNGWPLSRKKTVRLLIALTLLVWATQTLLTQWAFGETTEQFVPAAAPAAQGATVELRNEATVLGDEIRLRQIARWTEADNTALAPMADLILARIPSGSPFRSITIDEVKKTLKEAGVNMATLNFTGAGSCTINRSDVEYDERTALRQWIDARQAQKTEDELLAPPSTQPAAQATAHAALSEKTLQSLLVSDLAQRFSLDPRSLQVNFKAKDQHVLNLAEPLFRFEIEPARGRNLGEVSWLVTIIAGDEVQKATIVATARAWQEQLVVSRPLAFKQIIQAEDLTERRTLIDRLPDDPLLARDAAIGQETARELPPGTILTARMVSAPQLVKPGQYVTITLAQGTVHIKTVAKAMEAGAAGQTIRVKNEATREVFQVIVTGPQTATMNLATDESRLTSAGNE